MMPTLPYLIGGALLLITLFPAFLLMRRPHPVATAA
jgi:hypothetical protein